ncbi:MAG: ribosome biogenesis GTP-binding protein YihA/YsxC [Labilithrix sp.]|nr:ribosome biogenesis GTP-binding protein YihA/YsxC [Labilithrix sp.]
MASKNVTAKKNVARPGPSKAGSGGAGTGKPAAGKGAPSAGKPAAGKGASAGKLAAGKGEGGVRVADAEFAAGAARRDQVPATSLFDDAHEIAFAGRSNVGKSSLLNMMLSRKGLARTSNTPGCTRQINFFDIHLAANEKFEVPPRLVFVDLPGYGYAKVSKSEATAWKQLLEGYLHERPTLRAVVVLVDVRRGLEDEEADLVEFLAERPGIRVIVAATKVDKLSLSAQKPALAKLARGPDGERLAVVGTSAETGAGREVLWARILDACRADEVASPEVVSPEELV